MNVSPRKPQNPSLSLTALSKDSHLFDMIYVLGTASHFIMEEPLQMVGKSDCLKGKSDIYRYHYQYLLVL